MRKRICTCTLVAQKISVHDARFGHEIRCSPRAIGDPYLPSGSVSAHDEMDNWRCTRLNSQKKDSNSPNRGSSNDLQTIK